MSPIHLGFLAASGAASKYYVAAFRPINTNETYLKDVKIDSLGNVIAVGDTNYDYFALKMNELGPDISYLRYAYKTNQSGFYFENLNSIYLDSSNNIYCSATTPETPSGESSFGYMKLNSSLGLTFLRRILHNENLYSNNIVSDGTNVWLTGYEDLNGSSASRWMFTKNSTSNAAASVQRTLYTGTSGTESYDSCLDSSGNLYIIGYMVPTTGNVQAILAKIDTSGNLSWARNIGLSAGSDIGNNVAFDGTNIIVAVRSFSYGTNGRAISFMKFNTSGTLLSQTGYSGGVSGLQAQKMVIDSSGNIYTVMTDYDKPGNGGTRILKMDSNLNIVWQRNVYSDSMAVNSITLDANQDLYVVGELMLSSGMHGYVMYYPKDGSVVGSASIGGRTVTINAATDSIITSSLTSASISLTSASQTFSDSDITVQTLTNSLSDTPLKVNI